MQTTQVYAHLLVCSRGLLSSQIASSRVSVIAGSSRWLTCRLQFGFFSPFVCKMGCRIIMTCVTRLLLTQLSPELVYMAANAFLHQWQKEWDLRVLTNLSIATLHIPGLILCTVHYNYAPVFSTLTSNSSPTSYLQSSSQYWPTPSATSHPLLCSNWN